MTTFNRRSFSRDEEESLPLASMKNDSCRIHLLFSLIMP